ncbi:MAG TPA: N-formylglutamate amidohydrolase [Thermoanaerobaculia bacterium]|nr:N-formylglutamate amidohydrolase [Thermoanaerobaculia bacterium]
MQPLSRERGLARSDAEPRPGTAARPAAARAPGSVHLWEIETGDGPVLATALHAGHGVRAEAARRLALGEDVRLREEDPSTERFTRLSPGGPGGPGAATRVVVRVSRFEVDLNRARNEAVYASPEAAWGLDVWGDDGPPPELLEAAPRRHDAFYDGMRRLLRALAERWGRVLVLDLHSYNHRRGGPAAPPEDPFAAPEINVGTGWIDRRRWAPVVERFLSELATRPFLGRRLDVRENVKFRGGFFPRWVAETFPETVCPLAVEVKKIYMDEWTGETYLGVVEGVRRALVGSLPGTLEALRREIRRGI